ncbi:hypothetical protein GCM10010919_19470 [Alishewanella longhuensis]|uniref:Flagellar hook-length control protein-like C-terminal domain-containing protein n=1 Tax=Alishewanella longhuensis TaxID=1091037 RepID=A0ABQ3L708_9ALTE|nr:flagellar hook-length control protein FliK [Alishewanella longhuensis]GHG69495.1 hypothetical protein GCM10010919_19470 [Alishewanella longhuensis]
MTQGLQFSLLFNGLDSHATADSAVVVPERQAMAYSEQAVAFSQVLEGEQQNKAPNKGQTVAASQSSKHRVSKEATTNNAPNVSAAEVPKTATIPRATGDSSAELADAAESSADQWLGLIRQASDASTLLRQKAEPSTLLQAAGFVTNAAQLDRVNAGFDNTYSEITPMLTVEPRLLDSHTSSEKALLLEYEILVSPRESIHALLSPLDVADSDVLPPLKSSGVEIQYKNELLVEPKEVSTSKINQQVLVPETELVYINNPEKVIKGIETTTVISKSTSTNRASPLTNQPVMDINQSFLGSSKVNQTTAIAFEKAPSGIENTSNQLASYEQQAKQSASMGQPVTLSENSSGIAQMTEAKSDMLLENKNAALANDPKVKAAESELTNSYLKKTQESSETLSSVKTLTDINSTTALKSGIASDSHMQRSPAAPGDVGERKSPTNLTDNAIAAGIKISLSKSNDPESTGLLQESAASGDEPPLDASFIVNNNIQSKSPKEMTAAARATSKLQDEAAILRGVSIEQQAEQKNVRNSDEHQAELAALGGATHTNTNANKAGSSAAEYSGSESSKQNMIKATADTAEKGSQPEQQHQQRQENRQYHFNRLEITLQQSSSQNPTLTQTATLNNTAETINPLYRAEQFSSVLEQLNRPQSLATAPSLAAQLKQLNLQQQDAAGQLRERVQLMVRQNVQFAEIRLDPAELGQMQIRINLQQEQASVQFIVQQQHAKELLEQQMPRLRELLQQQGMQLGEGQVQQQAKDDRQSTGQQSGQQQPGQVAEQEDLGQMASIQVKHSDRLVDYYA